MDAEEASRDDAITHDTLATRLAGFARARPHDTAIDAGAQSLSWRELDREASAIATAIADASTARGGNVCLLLRDRVDAAKAIAGVVRSGSVYVPFDPDDPQERLQFMLADSEPVVVLAAGDTLAQARHLAPEGCTILDLGEATRHAARELAPVPARQVAHIYYTSGSTGQPKGVCQTHANQLHFADTYARRVGVGPGDRQSLLYSIGYAAALGDVYRALALGATLCPYDLKRDGVAGLADWVDRHRVTLLHTFPMVFREIAKRIDPGRRLTSLRVLQLDGESAFASDFALFLGHTAPHCRLLTQLAATELTLMAQNLLDHGSEVVDGAALPVGLPAEGVRIEIRRADGELAATGEVGSIVVHSRHLSPGYWKRAELDARAFVPDPIDPLARRYRTGDIGRFDADGVLHFLGRDGTRVKIRGHTVELGEVEAALVACEAAVGVAVTAEQDPADTAVQRLVAWIEPRDAALRDPVAIRRFLAARLPMHMLPADVRFAAELPRTPSGKVDRAQLAGVALLAPQLRPFEPSRDATEAAVAYLFVDLLKLDRVGRDEDFFLAGGDSMLASELQERITEAFGVRVAGFHRDATVAGIAQAIRVARTPTEADDGTPAQAANDATGAAADDGAATAQADFSSTATKAR